MWNGVFGDDGGGLGYNVDSGSTQGVDVGAPRRHAGLCAGERPGRLDHALRAQRRRDALRPGDRDQPVLRSVLVVKIAPIAAAVGPLGKPTLRVGEQVIGGRTKLGAVVDVTGASEPVLSHYVSDAGNGASIRVEPATAPAMP